MAIRPPLPPLPQQDLKNLPFSFQDWLLKLKALLNFDEVLIDVAAPDSSENVVASTVFHNKPPAVFPISLYTPESQSILSQREFSGAKTPLIDIRAGSNTTVTRDGLGFIISVSTALDQSILANMVFGG